MAELYFSARLHTEAQRRQEALIWLKDHARPKKKDNPAAYWKWWRMFHFAMNDETWHRFVARTHRPKLKRYKTSSPLAGAPAYRKPGHPLHADYLSHARAYNKRYQAK